MEAIFSFNDTHSAIESESKLLSAGLAVGMMARPTNLGGQCGFCLRLDGQSLERAKKILTEAGIVWEGVYVKSEGSKPPAYEPLI
jgi:hypothetical protein